MSAEQKRALRLLLSEETKSNLRELLLELLVKATDKQITMIQAVAIKDIFEVGMNEIGVKPKE